MTHLIAAAAACMSLSHSASSNSAADQAPQRADQIKAGYLFNFARFVEWPPAASGDEITFCFLGSPRIQESLAVDLADKRVGARRVAVRSLQPADSAEGCHVLYLDEHFPAAVHQVFCSSKRPMLTVSEARSFIRDGGMIMLYTENNHLRFVISMSNAQRVALRISSGLLQLASAVEQDAPP